MAFFRKTDTQELRNRIITAAAPRATTEKPSDSQIETSERTVLSECFKSILGTGGSKSATRRFERTDADLIEFYKENEREYRNFLYDGFKIPCVHSAC